MTENNYACKDGLWGHCGALGDALRRASEAERKVEELQDRVKELEEATPSWWQLLIAEAGNCDEDES